MPSARLFTMIALVAMLAPDAKAGGLTLAAIKARYQNLSGFHAEAEQVKTSPMLLRPVTTPVTIDLQKGLLTWQAKGQAPWQIRFSDSAPPVFVSGGPTLDSMPASAKQKLNATLTLLHAVMTMSPRLEQDFRLTLVGTELTVEPRQPNPDLFFSQVMMSFKPDGTLETMLFATKDDATKIIFKTLTISR